MNSPHLAATNESTRVESHSQTIYVTRFCVKCLSLQQLGNGRGFTAHLGIFNVVFILTTNIEFTRVCVFSFVMPIAMGFCIWSETRTGAKGFLCCVLALLYATGISKCDLGYAKNSSRSDKRYGLGFLNLGRRNFITDKAEKYRNNLVLTRIRNAQKLNATCIGKYLLLCCLPHGTSHLSGHIFS